MHMNLWEDENNPKNIGYGTYDRPCYNILIKCLDNWYLNHFSRIKYFFKYVKDYVFVVVEGGRVEGERIYLLMENFTAYLLSTFYLAKQEFQSVCPKGISLATRILKNVTLLWICARRSQSSFSSLQKILKRLHRRAVSKT